MKKNYPSLIFRILGIVIIVAGIILTIIPLFNFDVFTFNLGLSIITAFGFTFVGIVMIVISVILNTSFGGKNVMNEIAENVKKELQEGKEVKKPKKCKYCGSTIDTTQSKCPNCGAEYKTKNQEKA